MTRPLWTDSEDELIRSAYPEHGPTWDGWAELLPNRSRRAIGLRASRLGVIMGWREQPEDEPIPDNGRHDRIVMRGMAAGKSPSQIDRENHWVRGTARRIVLLHWEQDKQRMERP